MKKCFNTKNYLPLFFFQKDYSKYQIKADYGRCKICRFCNLKISLKKGGVFARFENKYEFRKMNKLQIIKYFLK
jgi:hypothetical protein